MTSRPAALVLALALAAGASACNRSQADSPKAEKPAAGAPAGRAIRPIAITTGRAETRPVQRTVETSGSLLAWEEVQAKSEQPGTLARLRADLGDRVNAGDTLAEYDRREFQLAVDQTRADLGAARESLARAQATVAASEAALRRVIEGRAALEADVARAQAQVEFMRAETERTRQLFAKDLVAAREVDNMRHQMISAEALLTSMRTALAQHPDQVRVAEAQLRSDQAAVRVAEATVKQREAALGIAEKRYGDTTVKAPISGVVARRHVSAGEFVKDNTVLFTLVLTNPLKYVGTVPERQAPEIRTGQTLRLSVGAYGDKAFAGSVVRVAPAVDVGTRTLAIEARVPNPGEALRPGFFARGHVLTREDPSVVVVPADAVMVIAGLTKVFVVAQDRAQERLVKLGSRQGGAVEIADGVKAGEIVATSNLPSLYHGAPVSLAPAK